MTTFEKLAVSGHDFESTHLLCGAVARKAELEACGFTVVLLTETLVGKFVVYFLAHKPAVSKGTRAQRGCSL